VLKRFASIADPAAILLVILVDEGPVKIEWDPDKGDPPLVKKKGAGGLMFLPLLGYEDGYGFSYGVRFATPEVAGSKSRLSFPLTWGGDRRAAAELEKVFDRGPITRFESGASIGERTNPFYEEDDTRGRMWVRGERQLARYLGLGATGSWEHVSFADDRDRLGGGELDVAFDSRRDPALPRNAVFARASWERLHSSDIGWMDRTTIDARGYVGLFGQSVVELRALRKDADRHLPPYLQPLLGGMENLRGFPAGHAAGDSLLTGSIEVREPLTSPLSVGKLGVSAFFDLGTVYDEGERLPDQKFDRGVGGGVWFFAAVVRLNLVVAHGVGGSTRVHFGAGLTF